MIEVGKEANLTVTGGKETTALTAAPALNADLQIATSAFLRVVSALWGGAAITGESRHKALRAS
jgi:hypothetical protein